MDISGDGRVNHIDRLRKLFADSARHIEEHGHHQHDMWEGKACCIMGAPRMIESEGAYGHIARHVLDAMGYDEIWNDVEGRTKEDVVKALHECAINLSEDDLKATYGLRWSGILDFITALDDWTEDDYKEVEENPGSFTYPPEYGSENQMYLNALASYMATIVTSSKAVSNSEPYKRYFDNKYEGGL